MIKSEIRNVPIHSLTASEHPALIKTFAEVVVKVEMICNPEFHEKLPATKIGKLLSELP
jgi:hypothetical protein